MQLALMAKETRKKKLDLMKTEDDVAEAVQSKRITGPEKRKGSALSNRPGSTMAEDKGDTFLTDMLFKKQQDSKITPAKQKIGSKPVMSAKGQRVKSDMKKQASEIDSDEYQDMVFDIDYGRQLVQNADDFLSNKTSKVLEGFDSTSQSGQTSRDFINQNKGAAFQKN